MQHCTKMRAVLDGFHKGWNSDDWWYLRGRWLARYVWTPGGYSCHAPVKLLGCHLVSQASVTQNTWLTYIFHDGKRRDAHGRSLDFGRRAKEMEDALRSLPMPVIINMAAEEAGGRDTRRCGNAAGAQVVLAFPNSPNLLKTSLLPCLSAWPRLGPS